MNINGVTEEIAVCGNVDTVTVCETIVCSQRKSVKANLVTQMRKMIVVKRMKMSQKKAHWQKKIFTLKKLSEVFHDIESTKDK